MKHIFSIVAVLALTAFSDGYYPDEYSNWRPLFMSREMLEQSVRYIPASEELREVKNTGKIYYKYPYLFMNERYKGVHVFNLNDPTKPTAEGFILAPGCIDMAVKGDVMYLDNAVDMVSFDLTNRVVTKRIRNVFPEPVRPGEAYSNYYGDRPENSILVEWRKTNETY